MNTKPFSVSRGKGLARWVVGTVAGWDFGWIWCPCLSLCSALSGSHCPIAFLVSKQSCLFFQILFLSLLIKLFYYVRHFCLLLEHFKCVFIWKFEPWSTKLEVWKPTQHQESCRSRGRRLFAFGFQTAAETVEDSSGAEELGRFLGVADSQEACSLQFLSACDGGFYWKRSFVCPVALGLPASWCLWILSVMLLLSGFCSSLIRDLFLQRSTCLPSFLLSFFSAQFSVNLKQRRLEFQPAARWWPLGRAITHKLPFSLGFSVNASSERLNMGEIETLDDYWWCTDAEYLPLCQPSLLPNDHGFSSLDTTCIHHLLSVTLQQITEPIISGFFFLALRVQDYFKPLLVSISDCP